MKKRITNVLVSKLSKVKSRVAGNNRVSLEAARRTIGGMEADSGKANPRSLPTGPR